MAKSHHSTKKTHVKRKKHRQPIIKSKSPASIDGKSHLKYKSVKATAIVKKFIAVALCFLILLGFLSPVIFSVTQSLQSKHSKEAVVYVPISLSTQNIFTSFSQSFQSNIPFEKIEEDINNALKELAHLKRIEMGIPDVVYLHSRHSPFPTLSAFPEVVLERQSEEDIEVDLTHAFDSDTVYECPIELEEVFCRIVEREAGNQPFLGQLILAEGVVSRVYSGAYGNSSTNDILIKGYSAELEDDGKLHIYNREGKEFITYPEDVANAVRLALQGSRVSHTILMAVTELQNTKYGLQLDDTYSQWGAMYHYSPGGLEARQLRYRSIRRAPVSFQLAGHVFFGRWLPESLQLNL